MYTIVKFKIKKYELLKHTYIYYIINYNDKKN